MSNIDKPNLMNPGTLSNVTKVKAVAPVTSEQHRQLIAESGKDLPPANVADNQKESKIAKAAKEVSGYIQNITREINFSVDEELGKTVITVIDEETGDVIRQIPNEEILKLAKSIANLKDLPSRGVLFQGDV